MNRSRYSDEQIAYELRQADGGTEVRELREENSKLKRRVTISHQTNISSAS